MQKVSSIISTCSVTVYYIFTRVRPEIQYGQISGHFEYPTGYQILKLSGWIWVVFKNKNPFKQTDKSITSKILGTEATIDTY